MHPVGAIYNTAFTGRRRALIGVEGVHEQEAEPSLPPR